MDPSALLLAVCLTAAGAATPAAPAKAERPVEEIALENRLLSEEIALAKQPRIYVVFDVPGRRVQIKARGVVFREWALDGAQVLGHAQPVKPTPLLSRSGPSQPERFRVKPPPPPEPEKGSAQSPDGSAQAQSPGTGDAGIEIPYSPQAAAEELSEKALEVTDMPRRYDLLFGDNLRVAVLPRASGFRGGLSSTFSALGFYIRLPYRFLSARISKKPITIVRLSMDAADAQALYWSFPEGTNALFRLDPPAN